VSDTELSLPDLPCQEFVALVTDYLDEALPSRQREIVTTHLASCDGCTTVLAQWRVVIALAGRLRTRDVDGLDPAVREQLFAAFRRIRRPDAGAPPR
jgi:anti-sigma factor RsiW